jgi:hypothetical protein
MANLFGAIFDPLKGVVDGTVDLASKGTDMVTKPLGDVANATVMKIPGADAVKGGIDSATNAVTDVATKSIDMTTDMAGKGLTAAGDLTTKGADMVTKPLGDVADATVMKIPGADAVKGGIDSATNATMEGLKKADEMAAEGTKSVTSTVGNATTWAAGGVTDAFEKLGAAAGFQAMMGGVFGGDVDKSDEGLATLFKSVDTDGSGKISEVEMKEAIKKAYGKDLEEEVFKSMMKAADTDGDGEIDLEEFKVIMRAGPEKK